MKRRNFLKKTILTGTGIIAIPTIVPSSVFGKNAPSNRILIGAIGTGRISRGHDMPGVMQDDQARIVAVCDVDIKRANEARIFVETAYAAKNISQSPQVYQNYLELLENKDLDAVLISTPDHWHAKPVIDAAYAGKNIYVQKPFSYTLREGRLMSDAIAKTGRILQIGTQQRSMEQFRFACELVRNGRIGELKKIKIGLPIDPAGSEEPEMPIPPNLNYDMWLGSTPYVYYTENRVHPQEGYDRPGWLRCEPYCLGMITGWGVHHVDIAHWAMDTELTGPVEIEGTAVYPTSGLWSVHGKYRVQARYANGVQLEICDEFPNGVRFEGSEGWIFVTRGNYAATSSDPTVPSDEKPLQASNPAILTSTIGANEIHLTQSADHHLNWLNSIRTGKPNISPAEVGHRSTSVCILSHIAMKLKRPLHWDPKAEQFRDDKEANSMLSRPEREPYQITPK
ncbi:MAG: Gfo/Idh/MocA family oxidoreductase [Bacteroidales bacterium]|nr:Gfo/Idh/MocA family oxidoreductase [Bacteroidales bacterium]